MEATPLMIPKTKARGIRRRHRKWSEDGIETLARVNVKVKPERITEPLRRARKCAGCARITMKRGYRTQVSGAASSPWSRSMTSTSASNAVPKLTNGNPRARPRLSSRNQIMVPPCAPVRARVTGVGYVRAIRNPRKLRHLRMLRPPLPGLRVNLLA